jgi:predicted  nucleic acid-binding Zn-ribbon protein
MHILVKFCAKCGIQPFKFRIEEIHTHKKGREKEEKKQINIEAMETRFTTYG